MATSLLPELLPCSHATLAPTHHHRTIPTAHVSSFQGIRLPKLSFASRSVKPRIRPVQALVADVPLAGSANPTLYELLGLSADVELPEIKQAYRQMARKYHPDVCPLEESTRRFIEIQEAYETLSDPRRRAMYDGGMMNGLVSGKPGRKSWDSADQMEWRSQWEDQLSGLKRRSAVKNARAESWASRVRSQKERATQAV